VRHIGAATVHTAVAAEEAVTIEAAGGGATKAEEPLEG
jgi:hypothetical protein